MNSTITSGSSKISGGVRVHRSRLQSACGACKRRKSRCKIVDGGRSCAMCSMHGTSCDLNRAVVEESLSSRASATLPSAHVRKPTRNRSSQLDRGFRLQESIPRAGSSSFMNIEHVDSPDGSYPEKAIQSSPLAEQRADELHVVGPMTSDDCEILAPFFLTTTGTARFQNPLNKVSSGTRRPVQFALVRTRPLGIDSERDIPSSKLNTITKLIEPHETTLVKL
jgi:hypothetical protein